MKDLTTFLAAKFADKYAHITDENEIFESENVFETADNTSELRSKLERKKKEAKEKRIEDIKAQLAALQDELKKIEASDDSVSLEEVERAAKRSAAAKKAAQTRKQNQKWWDEYNSSTPQSGGCGYSSSRRSSGGCGYSGYSRGGC